MKLKGVQDTCQRIENGTDPPWLRINSHFLCRRYCILTWCRDFAFCLKQSVYWREECTRGILKLIWGGRSINIKVESVSNGPSYSFDVQRCYKRSGWPIYINIRLLDGTVQGNGMYKIPFLYIMKKFIIYSLIHFILKSTSLSVHPIIPSFLRSCEN